MKHIIIVLIALYSSEWSHVAASQVPRVRGIPASKASLYAADRDFQCLDGSLFIPFSRVNDDYCDCGDGSDEPGTAACSNGSFYCQNAGHQAGYIPSSWVNDGFCDCCDASDEYASGTSCVDNCRELGREARLEAQKKAELAREGNKIRMNLITRGRETKSKQQTHLVKLRTDYEEAERVRREKEALKNRAEEREKLALEKYKPVETEQLEPEGEGGETKGEEREDYFRVLDTDASGTVTLAEIQAVSTFDKDKNGEVSIEEAKYFLNNKDEVTQEEFSVSVWSNIKPFLMLQHGTFKPAGREDTEDTVAEQESLDAQDKDEDEDLEEEREEHPDEQEQEDVEEPEPEPQYDEETQSLVNEADKAREQLKDAENSVRDLQAEIKKLEEKIDRDYGPEDEFATLDGECFEYTDLEYVYSLCLFGKAMQRSKSGGSDVILGHWSEWAGPEGRKYSSMKYDRGLSCWNGPTRSTMVTLSCGMENKLLSVSEPNRCEYAMEFASPAVCKIGADGNDAHDEL